MKLKNCLPRNFGQYEKLCYKCRIRVMYRKRERIFGGSGWLVDVIFNNVMGYAGGDVFHTGFERVFSVLEGTDIL